MARAQGGEPGRRARTWLMIWTSTLFARLRAAPAADGGRPYLILSSSAARPKRSGPRDDAARRTSGTCSGSAVSARGLGEDGPAATRVTSAQRAGRAGRMVVGVRERGMGQRRDMSLHAYTLAELGDSGAKTTCATRLYISRAVIGCQLRRAIGYYKQRMLLL